MQIAPSLLKRNIEDIATLLGDKGYDDRKICTLTREKEMRLLIKHCECLLHHKAWKAQLNAELYGQRSQSETVNSRLKPAGTRRLSAPDTSGINFVKPLVAISLPTQTRHSDR